MHAFEKKYHWGWYSKWKKNHNLIWLYHNGKINTNDSCAILQLILFLLVYLWHIKFLPCKISIMKWITVCRFGIRFLLKCYQKHDSGLYAYEKHFSSSYIWSEYLYDECILQIFMNLRHKLFNSGIFFCDNVCSQLKYSF